LKWAFRLAFGLTQAPEGTLQFETGNLTKEQLEGLLNALPVDITFVDANDTVQYFNKPEKRFFVRTKAVIGRKVQMCHPRKSFHVVSKIVESFKTGKNSPSGSRVFFYMFYLWEASSTALTNLLKIL